MSNAEIQASVEAAVAKAEYEQQKELEIASVLSSRKAAWPFVVAWFSVIMWVLPLFGLPLSIATIIGGWKARRKGVLIVGIITLVLTGIISAVGVMLVNR